MKSLKKINHHMKKNGNMHFLSMYIYSIELYATHFSKIPVNCGTYFFSQMKRKKSEIVLNRYVGENPYRRSCNTNYKYR